MMKKALRGIGFALITAGMIYSCTAWQPELGEDLLPPGDDVHLYYDTIFDISSYPVSGRPLQTSEINYQSSTVYMLGNLADTITGTSTASIFTQFDAPTNYIPGPHTEIDSILLHLYIPKYHGDLNGSFTFTVYEATKRIYIDSLYYSDFDMDGGYDPAWIAEQVHRPRETDTVEILIRNLDFIQKFLDVAEDTSLFNSDSLFKDYFNGLYLTATSPSQRGLMAEIGLSDAVTRLTLKYSNDSVDVDSTETKEFVWATFPVSQYYSQKINIFKHDYSGTALAGIIDKDSTEVPYAYVQGMSGVNTMLHFNDLQDWFGSEKISISAARLIFDVVPENISGIAAEDLPGNLMLYTELDDGSIQPLYDWQANYDPQSPLTAFEIFGGDLETVSKGMFYDTTYRYSFNVNLHLQYMVEGLKTDTRFRLRSAIPKTDTKITKLWSNLFDNPARIRLEVVYLKL